MLDLLPEHSHYKEEQRIENNKIILKEWAVLIIFILFLLITLFFILP